MSVDVIPDTISLAYTLAHEAWYNLPDRDQPRPVRALHITCRRDRPGHDSTTVWDLTLTEQRDGLLALEGQSASWLVFAQSCAFLAALTGGHAVSIAAMRLALQERGAVDETVRSSPYATLAG